VLLRVDGCVLVHVCNERLCGCPKAATVNTMDLNAAAQTFTFYAARSNLFPLHSAEIGTANPRMQSLPQALVGPSTTQLRTANADMTTALECILARRLIAGNPKMDTQARRAWMLTRLGLQARASQRGRSWGHPSKPHG